MKSPHLLLAGSNCRRLKSELTSVLSAAALTAIEGEIQKNVAEMFRLGLSHHAFATGPARREWRQCVSRLYYACYAVSRSVRLEVDGHFTTESTDHKRVGDLPEDFPRREQFKNQLVTLRDDRNLADYDHTATEMELVFPVADAIVMAQDFIDEAGRYLTVRGVPL
jgi:hypothetical protein